MLVNLQRSLHGRQKFGAHLSAKKKKHYKDVQSGKDVNPNGFPVACLHILSLDSLKVLFT